MSGILLNPYIFASSVPPGPPPAPVLWKPTSLLTPLGFWFNDESAVTNVSGNASQWNDKSGNNWHVTQGTSGARPLIVTGDQAGRRVLQADGGDVLAFPAGARGLFRNVGAGWMAAVYRKPSGSQDAREIIQFNTNVNAARFVLGSGFTSYSGPYVGGRRVDGNSFHAAIGSSEFYDQWVIMVGIMDWTNRIIQMWINGQLAAQNTSAFAAGGSTSNTDSNNAGIFSGPATPGSAAFSGKGAEFLGGAGFLSAPDRQRIEGHLAHWWELTGNLDSGHPYKTDPPYEETFDASGITFVAHRGSALRYPENTDVAYERTLDDGVDEIEQDLYLTSEGALVCSHDADATYVTTSTAAFSSLTNAQVAALTVDSADWHGVSYSPIAVPLFSAVLAAHKGEGAYFAPEIKGAFGTEIVAELTAESIPTSQVMVSSFTAAHLAPVVTAGYDAQLLSSGADILAAGISAGVESICYIKSANPRLFLNAVAEPMPVWAYTINRRHERDYLASLGVSGFYTDDPQYLRTDAPLATSDAFDQQRWMAGMIDPTSASESRPLLANRGKFFSPDYWGYDFSTDNRRFCLQGWACPIKSNPGADNFTIDLDITFDSATDPQRWAALFIADRSMKDRAYDNENGNAKGYAILFRKNGTLNIYRQDNTAANITLLTTETGSSISDAAEVSFRVVVSPTAITVHRMSGGSPVQTATVSDATYRGGYFHLGRFGLACKFRNIAIT